MYANARHDENSVPTLCGISDLDGSVIPIQIDPVTGRILIELMNSINNSPVLSGGRAAKDGNSVATILGTADDGSGVLIPGIYHTNQLLFVDLIVG